MQIGLALASAATVKGRVEVSRQQFSAATMTVAPSEWHLHSPDGAQIIIPGDGAAALICHASNDGVSELGTGTELP